MPSTDQSSVTAPRSFANANLSTEDLLKSQTVGLVRLDDFRKRRAEVLEQKEKEAQDRTYGFNKTDTFSQGRLAGSTGTNTGAEEVEGQPPTKKTRKQKPKPTKGLLSFGDEDDEQIHEARVSGPEAADDGPVRSSSAEHIEDSVNKRLAPNPISQLPVPQALTKAALQAEAATRDKLRREFLAMQEAVRATEIAIPFVFYDGTNVPGGAVKLKKGDPIWLFLERARKVGAGLGTSGKSAHGAAAKKNRRDSRRGWARVSVDDLMCVRGEMIVPHHYEFYYFIANKVSSASKAGGLLFDYSDAVTPPTASQSTADLRVPTKIEELEGFNADPALTKVVDRRWYERNKHIYPANLWKEYEPGREFEEGLADMRRDAKGNAFFFS